MKKWGLGFLLGATFLVVYPLWAADWQQDVNELRQDIRELHQKLYNIDEKPAATADNANSQMQNQIEEYGATLHNLSDRLDELENKIKQYNEELDKFNQKIDLRLKVLENHNNAAGFTDTQGVTSDETAGAASVTGGIINANKPEDMYANAMQAYNNGLYDEAELAFADIVKQFPQHALAGNAQYWLGEVYVKQGNLNKAKTAFKDGYEKYKSGNKAPDSLYRLGVTLANMQDKQRACIVFMSFGDEFPKANAGLSNKAKSEATKLGCK